MKKQGFTLIELLVVIGIVALLSSIVLTSLGNSRKKAQDAAIKREMLNLRTAVELYRSKTGSYGTASQSCTGNMWSDTNIQPILASLQTRVGTANPLTCAKTATAWEVNAKLAANPNWFCVDGKAQAKESTLVNISDYQCGGTSGSSFLVTVNFDSNTGTITPGSGNTTGTITYTFTPKPGYLVNTVYKNYVPLHTPYSASPVSYPISVSAGDTVSALFVLQPSEA